MCRGSSENFNVGKVSENVGEVSENVGEVSENIKDGVMNATKREVEDHVYCDRCKYYYNPDKEDCKCI